VNLNIKVIKVLYHWFLLLDQFRFCETRFTTNQGFVAEQSAISPFLGGIGVSLKSWKISKRIQDMDLCEINRHGQWMDLSFTHYGNIQRNQNRTQTQNVGRVYKFYGSRVFWRLYWRIL